MDSSCTPDFDLLDRESIMSLVHCVQIIRTMIHQVSIQFLITLPSYNSMSEIQNDCRKLCLCRTSYINIGSFHSSLRKSDGVA